MEDLDKLEEIAKSVKDLSLCGLGKSAPLPVLSTIRMFRDEYMEHIVDKKCASHTCTALRNYYINPENVRDVPSVREIARLVPSPARRKSRIPSIPQNVSSVEHV